MQGCMTCSSERLEQGIDPDCSVAECVKCLSAQGTCTATCELGDNLFF
jgi:hypothetical protein